MAFPNSFRTYGVFYSILYGARHQKQRKKNETNAIRQSPYHRGAPVLDSAGPYFLDSSLQYSCPTSLGPPKRNQHLLLPFVLFSRCKSAERVETEENHQIKERRNIIPESPEHGHFVGGGLAGTARRLSEGNADLLQAAGTLNPAEEAEGRGAGGS